MSGVEAPIKLEAQMPDWAQYLTTPNIRYFVIWGGRGSAKTTTVARHLIICAAQTKLRIVCVREHMESIKESSKQSLVDAIEELGLQSEFKVREYTIISRCGSYFFFRGVSNVTEEDVKGWQSIDICWVEEGQYLLQRSGEIMFPTVRGMSKRRSIFIITMNPKKRSDYVWRQFCRPHSRRKGAMVLKVNYTDNPWFTEDLELERQNTLLTEPERYQHVWLGKPDDDGAGASILSYEALVKCVEAYPKYRHKLTGQPHSGLDVADTGINAHAIRVSSALDDVAVWRSRPIWYTADKAHDRNLESGVTCMYFDAGGVGANIGSHAMLMGYDDVYDIKPVMFGGAVAGQNRLYSPRLRNKDFFMRRNAQLAWNMRLRQQNTLRLLDNKEGVNLDYCLFINPDIPNLEDLLDELTQPIRKERENYSSKVEVDKSPDGAPSPNKYDSVVLSFAQDSERGLTVAGRKEVDYLVGPISVGRKSVLEGLR